MSTTAVQQNAGTTNGTSAGANSDSQDISPLDQIFSKGSLSDPEQAKGMAQDLLDLNAQSPFLTEEEVAQLEAIVDDLGSGSMGEQIMALDRLVGLLIKFCPADSNVAGVDLADLQALDEMVSPLADSYRSFLEAVANQSAPAEQLGALQEFTELLSSLDVADLSQLGLSAADVEAFEAEVFQSVDSYKALLNTESAALVGSGNSWESFVGQVNDLKGSLEGLGINLEGSEIDSFISEYGSEDSMKNVSELDLLEQRSIVVSFKSDLLTEIDGSELSTNFVPGGVDKAREQVSVEEGIYAVGEVIQQDEYREYLTDAKSVLMGDGGSLAGATAEDFELYKSNLQAIAERQCAELDIPADPAFRTPAQQELAESNILLAMVEGSMAWADKWQAKVGTGSLTKDEAFSAQIELVKLDASMFKTIQNHVAVSHGTDSEIYMMVTSWFEKASEILLKVKDLLKMASNY